MNIAGCCMRYLYREVVPDLAAPTMKKSGFLLMFYSLLRDQSISCSYLPRFPPGCLPSLIRLNDRRWKREYTVVSGQQRKGDEENKSLPKQRRSHIPLERCT